MRRRIVFVMDYLDGAEGGTEGQLLALLRGLATRGVDARLVVLRETPYTRLQHHVTCPVSTLGIESIFSLRALTGMWRFSRELRGTPATVHIFFNDAAVLVPFFAKMVGCKVLVSRRDMGFWYTPLILMSLRVVNRFVDRVVTNSVAVAEYVRRKEWCRREKLRVIYNGYEIDRMQQPAALNLRRDLGIRDQDPIIGVVANLRVIKRIDDLLRAFVMVRGTRPNAHVVLAGTGPTEQALRRLARELGIEGNTHFLGSVPDAIPIVKHFSVGVLCSESEGFSNALIEYMACGVPPVCTRVGGNAELVGDGVNGFLVGVGDISALAERIGRLLDDPALASRIGVAAKQRVEQFTMGRMVDTHIEVYTELEREKRRE